MISHRARYFTLIITVIVVIQCLSACKKDMECSCIRSQISLSLKDSLSDTKVIDRINSCSDFIIGGGSHSFITSRFYFINKKYSLSSDYLLISLRKGINQELLERYEFITSLKSMDSTLNIEIIRASKYFENEKLDSSLFRFITSLYELDQDIRKKGNVIIDGSVISDMGYVDDYIFSKLNNHLLYDNLSEENISVLGTYRLYIILLHVLTHVDESSHNQICERLKNLTLSGYFNPQYYASIIDRRAVYYENSDPIYFEFNLDKRLSTMRQRTDCLRFNLGLSPLYLESSKIDSFLTQKCTSCF